MKNHVLSVLAIGGLLAGSLSLMPAQAAVQDIVQVSQQQRQADAQIILNEINKYRASKGVASVKFSNQLSGVVQKESDRQVVEEVVYHTDNFLNDPASGKWNSANEVIALSYGRDVKALVDWWKTSPLHEEAISDPRHEVIGVGLTYADGSLAYTGAPWQVLATVNLYGYNDGNEPADTVSAVLTVPDSTSQPAVVAPVYTVKGGIASRYNYLGGAPVLGQPVMNERGGLVGGGAYQEFVLNGKKTTLYWSPTTGARAVKNFGSIGQKWIAGGRERGYGYPMTEEIATPTQVYQKFSNGYTIRWAPGKGSWVTR